MVTGITAAVGPRDDASSTTAPGQARDEHHRAVRDGRGHALARAEPGGRERPGGHALARSPAGEVQRQRRRRPGRAPRAAAASSAVRSRRPPARRRRTSRRGRRRPRPRRARRRARPVVRAGRAGRRRDRAQHPIEPVPRSPGPPGQQHADHERDDEPPPRTASTRVTGDGSSEQHEDRERRPCTTWPAVRSQATARSARAGVARGPTVVDAPVHVAEHPAGEHRVEELGAVAGRRPHGRSGDADARARARRGATARRRRRWSAPPAARPAPASARRASGRRSTNGPVPVRQTTARQDRGAQAGSHHAAPRSCRHPLEHAADHASAVSDQSGELGPTLACGRAQAAARSPASVSQHAQRVGERRRRRRRE